MRSPLLFVTNNGAFMLKDKILHLIFFSVIFLLSLKTLATNIITKNTSVIFDILTYNVQMRPILDNNSYKAPQISSKLNKYNIAVLQESFCNKSELLQYCSHPFSAHHTDKYSFLSWVDSGLSTLSNFPIIEIKNTHFRSRAGFQDIIASKGILLTRIEINGLTVDIYNTHMQAEDYCGGTRARMDQAQQIYEFITENSPKTHSVILIGDFNMSPQRFSRDVVCFRQQHEALSEQTIFRNFTFSMLQESLNLTDLSDTLFPNKFDYVDRILYRSGSEADLSPISIETELEYFTDEQARPLSDGTPIVGTFSIGIKNSALSR